MVTANIRKLSGDIVTYALSFGLNSALPFLLLPLLTRYLSPADYGRVALFQVLITLAGPMVGLSLHGAIQRFYFDCKFPEESKRFASYVSGAIAMMMVSTLMLAALVYGGRSWAEDLFELPAAWIFVGLATAFGTCLIQVQLAISNARMRPGQYALLSNFQTVLNITITFMLVVGAGWAWEGRIVGIAGATVLTACCAVIVMFSGRSLWERPTKPLVRHALIFVVPLLPHSIAQVLRASLDRAFVNSFGGVKETGLFAVALALASLLIIGGQAIAQAWIPWLFRSLKEQSQSSKTIVIISYTLIGMFIAAGLSLAFIGPWMFSWFIGDKFADATGYFRWLVAASTCMGAYYVIAPFIPYAGRNIYSSITSISALCLGAASAYVMGTLNGPIGVAQASFSTAFFELCLTAYFAQRSVPMPWLRVFSER